MATRHTRKRGQKPRRRWLRLVTLCAIAIAVVWAVPIVLVETPLRDAPLSISFAGIDGRIASGGAIWNWAGPIEYRSITLVDGKGRTVGAIPRLTVSRGLIGLATTMVRSWAWGATLVLGTVRVMGGEILVEVRPGGSSLEDILAPWLAEMSRPVAAPAVASSSAGVRCEVEVVNAAVELVDLPRDDSWRITDLLAAVTLRPAENGPTAVHGWTVAGRVHHGGRPSAAIVVASDALPADAPFDRTTITAGATAALARDGGWSISSPVPAVAGRQTLAVAANRLPLGVTSVAATRFMAAQLLDGLADCRLDVMLPGQAGAELALAVAGSVSGSELALCAADTLAELATIERCEVPLDLVNRFVIKR